MEHGIRVGLLLVCPSNGLQILLEDGLPPSEPLDATSPMDEAAASLFKKLLGFEPRRGPATSGWVSLNQIWAFASDSKTNPPQRNVTILYGALVPEPEPVKQGRATWSSLDVLPSELHRELAEAIRRVL